VTRQSLEIASLNRRAEGLAQGQEGLIAVPYALPGEQIEADVEGTRGALLSISRPSPRRVAPPCPYYFRCGGCSLQHADPVFYSEWKRSLIVSELTNRGLPAPVRPLMAAHGLGRRRVIFHARPTSANPRAVGFMAARSHDLVGIDACLLLTPGLRLSLPAARALASLFASKAPAFDIQFTAAAAGLDCDLRGLPRHCEPPLFELSAIARAHNLCRISLHGDPAIILSEPKIDIGGTSVLLPPGGFLQATAAGEQALAGFALRHLGKAKRAADLFCGIGAFALRLAEKLPVLAVDSDKAALDALLAAWRGRQGLKPLSTSARNLFREPLSAGELQDFDFVVFDPPRQGAKAQAEQLAGSRCPTIIAISCNSATFARDAAILIAGGYELADVLPVDQFQWSAHAELAALFVKGSKRR
jgi:23S rRNA (uracil1939-C5)-methyltransferase